jgi:hypothetical protein
MKIIIVFILSLFLALPWACSKTYTSSPVTVAASSTPNATPTATPVCGTGTHPYVTQWGFAGTGNGQFQGAAGMAIGSNGDIYVCDFNTSRVQEFTPTGTYVSQFGSYGTGNGQMEGTTSVVVDGSGNFYVADYQNNRVDKFSSSGTFITY